MHAMFYECINLQGLNLNNFDTSQVLNMEAMFGYCDRLTSLIIDNFDTIFHPFHDNQSLKEATLEALILLVPVITCDLNCRDQT